MENICNYLDCTGCAACASGCPVKCISMQYDAEGYLRPKIDNKICINCSHCVKICPNNTQIQKNDDSIFYQAWHRNKDVLIKSSSGGFFTALSEYVFDRDGVVFGVYKDLKSKKLFFDYADNIDGLEKFKYSKYYQAEVGGAYKIVREFLKKDRLVLFTGTACQVAGLFNYLGNCYNRDLLITADTLCHGTPSSVAVETYLKDREKTYKKKIIDYQFRVKPDDSDWLLGGSTRMKLFFEDGNSAVQNQFFDTYYTAFTENIMLRESCYRCKYCGINRISDFTMADYWGVKNVPKEQLKYGVSLVLCNSRKSQEIIKNLSTNMVIQNADRELAMACNLALNKPNRRPIFRNRIYEKFKKNGFDKTIKRIFLKKYVKEFVLGILNRT